MQPWKEQMIGMLRARGVTFPASAAYKRGFADREVPLEDVEDIILGRKNLFLYPMKKK